MIQVKMISSESLDLVETMVNDFIKGGMGDPANLETISIQAAGNIRTGVLHIAMVVYEAPEEEE